MGSQLQTTAPSPPASTGKVPGTAPSLGVPAAAGSREMPREAGKIPITQITLQSRAQRKRLPGFPQTHQSFTSG